MNSLSKNVSPAPYRACAAAGRIQRHAGTETPMKYQREEFPLWHALKKQRHPLLNELVDCIEEARAGEYDEKCALSCILDVTAEKLANQPRGPVLSDEELDATRRQALEVIQDGVAAGHGRSLFFAAALHLQNGDSDKAKTCSDKIKDSADLSADEKEQAIEELKAYRPRRPAAAPGGASDGSYCAGTTGEGVTVYVAAEDAPAESFDAAMKGATAFTAHGHNDWSMPTSGELFWIYHNAEPGLADSFNREAAYWTQERGKPRVNELATGYSESGKEYEAQGIKLPVRYIRFEGP
jgi:hypothetical protein